MKVEQLVAELDGLEVIKEKIIKENFNNYKRLEDVYEYEHQTDEDIQLICFYNVKEYDVEKYEDLIKIIKNLEEISEEPEKHFNKSYVICKNIDFEKKY